MYAKRFFYEIIREKDDYKMKKITVNKNDTLLNYLFEQNLPYSKSKLKSLLKHRCISVNGKTSSQFNLPVKKGQVIEIVPFNHQLDLPFEIIYEDEQIIVINKPAGLLSIATDDDEIETAYRYVGQYLKEKNSKNKVFVVHRLDRDTSGVMLFAKDFKTKEQYQENWDLWVRKRKYSVVVEGQVHPAKGSITTPLKEFDDTFVRPHKDGKEAITNYELVSDNHELSLIDVYLQTGRKNQIRAHFASIGHPVVGDKKYGAKTNPIRRLGLHSEELIINNKRFIATTPRSFLKLIQ